MCWGEPGDSKAWQASDAADALCAVTNERRRFDTMAIGACIRPERPTGKKQDCAKAAWRTEGEF